MGFPRLRILDVRILGAIALILVAIASVGKPGHAPSVARPLFARGERRVEATSLAISTTGEWAATTDSAGRVVLRTFRSRSPKPAIAQFPRIRHLHVIFFRRALAGRCRIRAPAIYFWKVGSEDSEPVELVKVPIDPIRHIMFSPDGRSLAITADRDGTICSGTWRRGNSG